MRLLSVCHVTLLALLLTPACTTPEAQSTVAPAQQTPLFDPPFPLPAPPCGQGQLPDEHGTCRPAEAAVVGEGGRLFWVDQRHPAASDTNDGTRDRPWRTIGRATGAEVLRPGDGVLIRAGVYRETVAPRAGGSGPRRRVTYAAFPGDTVVVSGADPLDGPWERTASGWRHRFVHDLRAFADEDVFRRELFVTDGVVLRPVFAREDLRPGTFFVAGPDTATTAVYVALENGDRPPNVEGAHRARLFFPEPADRAHAECGDERQPAWLRLVGLTFRHAANRAQWGVVCAGSAHGLVEDVTVEWTNGAGIDTSGREHVFLRNRALDNGQIGFVGSCSGCLIEDNEAGRNNWKGYSPFWEAGGGKWTHTAGTTFRRFLAHDNDGPGLWLDIDNRDNTVEGGYYFRNEVAGIMLELATTGTRVVNNVVVATRWRGWSGAGLLSQAASHNTIVHNTLAHNEGTGLWLRLDPDRRAEDGHTTVVNNLIVGNAADPSAEAREVAVEGESVEQVRTNRFAGNVYGELPSGVMRSTFFVAPDPGDPAHYRGSDLARWRALTGATDERLVDPGPLLDAASGWRWRPGAAVEALVDAPWSVPDDVAGRPRPTRPVVGAVEARRGAR